MNYEVVLFDVGQDNYYPYKNEEVNLIFLGDVSYNAIIEKVIINNNEYQVKKVENSNIYTVNVGNNNTSGIKEYHFTEVFTISFPFSIYINMLLFTLLYFHTK